MRTFAVMAVWVGACSVAMMTPAYGETTGTCEHEFQSKFPQGGSINMNLQSSDVDIVGVDRAEIHITCDLETDAQRRAVSIRFAPNGYSAKLEIHGGSHKNLHFRIEIPNHTGLYVRQPAGDLEIRSVVGDKDVEIYAGDLTITGITASDFKTADASVLAGDLVATPFNVTKDGLFRSFSASNANGKYKLHAHLMAGDLTLR